VYNHSGFVFILPYLEQSPLYAMYDFKTPGSLSNIGGGTLPPTAAALSPTHPNAIVQSQKLKVFLCPSDKEPEVVSNAMNPADYYQRPNTSRSNYLFAVGHGTDYNAPSTWNNGGTTGAFGHNTKTKLTEITDGTSNTIAVGESVQIKRSTSFGPYWGSGTHTATMGYTPAGAPGYNVNADNTVAYGSACPTPGMPVCVYAWQFGSNHTGGANFVMGDGSVRFIRNSIAYSNFFAAATRAGGETLSLDN
jgi:prepilin-type processing-associated H-X9-DG protein